MIRNIIGCLLLSSSPVWAQIDNNSLIKRSPYPIFIKNGMYYYDLHRTTFDGLQLILNSMSDNQIDRSIKTVHTLRDAQDLMRIGFMSYAVIVILDNQQASSQQQSDRAVNVIIGGLGATVIVYFISKIYEIKAIKKYNSMLLKPRASFDQKSINFGLSYRF